MKTTAIAKTLTAILLTFGALTTTAACSSSPEPSAEDDSATTSDALNNESGGNSSKYCSAAGFCQCKGLVDCNEMFKECKALLYCNQDAQGLRCCCVNYSTRTGGGRVPPRVPTGDMLTK
jgi:hypothetical protein